MTSLALEIDIVAFHHAHTDAFSFWEAHISKTWTDYNPRIELIVVKIILLEVLHNRNVQQSKNEE